ncbi:MAG: sodium:solute symporter family protein [Clostridiaceae bacterium]|jgi:SSS family solute:Na+ symporter|nr:sodium:solute symporter family protein [Oscillospiraceae bacterium]NLO62709.1 sodium:solute symporter family protein [Clostridiaceae bacterium]
MLFKIIATVIYLAVLSFLAYSGFKGTKNASDYLVGGRQIHPIIMALSYGATFISTSAIVGFGGNAGLFGMSLLWLTFLNIFVGVFIAFVVFGKRTRKMGHNLDAHTFPELMGLRFRSKFIQGFSSILIFLVMPIYTAAVLKGGVEFMATTFNLSYDVTLFFLILILAVFVSVGGMKGVMYGDAFQAVIMFVGMAALVLVVYIKLGGIVSANEKLTALASNASAMDQMAGKTPAGFQGWTSMPAFNSPLWWTVVSSIVMGVGIGVLAQPQLVVRFMTVKSNRELNRAVVSGGVFILFMTGAAFAVGALSNVLFYEKYGQLSVTFAGKADRIIPSLITEFMPSWFSTIFMLALLAAALSTLTSLFHAIGTSFGRDFFEKTLGWKKNSVIVTRLGVVIAILITAVLAFVAERVEETDGVIVMGTSIFFGLCGAAFLPTYVGALYFKSLSRKAAISSVVTGAFVNLFWVFFIQAKSAKLLLLCNAIFGKDNLLIGTGIEKLTMVDSIVIALPVSVIVIVVVGLLTRKQADHAHVDACFSGIK